MNSCHDYIKNIYDCSILFTAWTWDFFVVVDNAKNDIPTSVLGKGANINYF